MIEIHLKPLVVFEIAGFQVTNAMISLVIVVLVLGGLLLLVSLRKRPVPGALQLMVETFLTMSWNFVSGIVDDKAYAKRLYPLFITLVLTFLFSNLLGVLPWWPAISVNDVPLWRPPTADYGFVLSVAFAMFIGWQLIALVTSGVFGYIKKYINFSSPIDFIMGLLDIIGELAKIISISFRLFGNLFAGEAIAVVIGSFVPVVAPIPFAMLGLLSAVVQALVFPILVLLFMQMSIASRGDSEEGSTAKAVGSQEREKQHSHQARVSS